MVPVDLLKILDPINHVEERPLRIHLIMVVPDNRVCECHTHACVSLITGVRRQLGLGLGLGLGSPEFADITGAVPALFVIRRLHQIFPTPVHGVLPALGPDYNFAFQPHGVSCGQSPGRNRGVASRVRDILGRIDHGSILRVDRA